MGDHSVWDPYSSKGWTKLKINKYARHISLIKLLKHQGMPQQQLTHSIIVSRILHALIAWGGFWSVELKNRINAFFKRLRQFGYINCVMFWLTIQIMSSLQRCSLQVIFFTICSRRIIQVICVCVVIFFSGLIIIRICIKNRSLFDLCMNISKRIIYWYLVVLLTLCFYCFYVFSMFYCYCIDVCLSHL